MKSKQYYSADQRLMVVQRYDYLVGSDADVGTWEEYRYDALGGGSSRARDAIS